jgi:hypothetical protein
MILALAQARFVKNEIRLLQHVFESKALLSILRPINLAICECFALAQASFVKNEIRLLQHVFESKALLSILLTG